MNEDISPIKNGDFPASHVSFRFSIVMWIKLVLDQLTYPSHHVPYMLHLILTAHVLF